MSTERDPEPITVECGERRVRSPAIDLTADECECECECDPARVVAAVRAAPSDDSADPALAAEGDPIAEPAVVASDEPSVGTSGDGEGANIEVRCPRPGPVHHHVGCIEFGMDLRVRTALAAAARARGETAPQDEEIRAIRAQIDDIETDPPPDLATARERLAGTAAAVERLRERVATLRGRVQTARERDGDASDLEARLRAATRELSEKETERAAAREALERARREARNRRQVSERRRELEDRLANRRRRARAHLVDRVREAYTAALASIPAQVATPGDSPAAPLEATGPAAALGIARIAELRAPVVLAVDAFASPADAAEWLAAPVIRVSD